MDEFPDDWIPASEKVGDRMTNDHGLLYLIGDSQDGEWLHTTEPLPPKYQNTR